MDRDKPVDTFNHGLFFGAFLHGTLGLALLFVQGWVVEALELLAKHHWLAFFLTICSIGVTQLVYMGPTIWAYRKRRPQWVKGLIAAAVVLFALMSTCAGAVVSMAE